MKFVKAKEQVVVAPTVEKAEVEKKKDVANQRVLNKPRNQSMVKSKAKGRSPPKTQRGPRMNHVCHHYGPQGRTRLNCHKLRALNNARDQRSYRDITPNTRDMWVKRGTLLCPCINTSNV